jgi:hypothetical protein
MDEAQEIIARIGTENPPTAAELTAARKVLAQAMKAARSEATPDLEALTSLRAAYDQVTVALEEAEAREAELAAEADALLEGLDDVEDAEVEPEVEPEAEPEVPEPTAEEVAAAGNPRVLPLNEALERFKSRVKVNEPAPPPAAPESKTNYSVLVGPSMTEHGDSISLDEMAAQFNRYGRAQRPGARTNVVTIQTDLGADHTLTASTSPDDVMRMLDAVGSPEAVAAAGGCCVLSENLPESTTPFDASRPLKASLPSMTVNGAVRWFPPVCLPQAGAAVWTCEDDAAVTADPETWKQCAEVECPEPEEVVLDAIYQCITIGNFQQRFNPSRWAEILRALTASKARLSEIHLWAKMLTFTTTTHQGEAMGSLYLNIVNNVLRAVEEQRQQQRLLDSVNFRTWLPSWVTTAVARDLSVRRLIETTEIEAANKIERALAPYGVRVTYSKDLHMFPSPQVSGPWAPYDDPITTIVAPEGFYTFMDGGELNLGTEIRDHDLNRQNKLAAFAETFEGVLGRGCDAKRVEIPVELCDALAPCAEGPIGS